MGKGNAYQNEQTCHTHVTYEPKIVILLNAVRFIAFY